MNLNILENAVNKSPKRYSLNRKSKQRADMEDVVFGSDKCIELCEGPNGQACSNYSSDERCLCSSVEPHSDTTNFTSNENCFSSKQVKNRDLQSVLVERNASGMMNVLEEQFTFSHDQLSDEPKLQEEGNSSPQFSEAAPVTQQSSVQFQRETKCLLEAMQSERGFVQWPLGETTSRGYMYQDSTVKPVGHNSMMQGHSYPYSAALPTGGRITATTAPQSACSGSPVLYQVPCYAAPQAPFTKYGLGYNQCFHPAAYGWRQV